MDKNFILTTIKINLHDDDLYKIQTSQKIYDLLEIVDNTINIFWEGEVNSKLIEVNDIMDDNVICFYFDNKMLKIFDFVTKKLIETSEKEYTQKTNKIVLQYRQEYKETEQFDKDLQQMNTVQNIGDLCQFCKIRIPTDRRGIFEYNGKIENKDIYCNECCKQITDYFIQLTKEQPIEYSYNMIRNIIEKDNYDKGLLVADTSFFSDDEIDRMHNAIKKISSNISEYKQPQQFEFIFSEEQIDIYKHLFQQLTGKKAIFDTIYSNLNFRKYDLIGYISSEYITYFQDDKFISKEYVISLNSIQKTKNKTFGADTQLAMEIIDICVKLIKNNLLTDKLKELSKVLLIENYSQLEEEAKQIIKNSNN